MVEKSQVQEVSETTPKTNEKTDKAAKVFTYKDVPKEWQEAVRDRALDQNVTEDQVIRYGLFHDFTAKKQEDVVQILAEIRDLLKKDQEKPAR